MHLFILQTFNWSAKNLPQYTQPVFLFLAWACLKPTAYAIDSAPIRYLVYFGSNLLFSVLVTDNQFVIRA